MPSLSGWVRFRRERVCTAFTPDQERRRAALLDAAVAVFAAHGFDAATTRAIAARAGCAEGLIHRYFGGKRGLLIAILGEKAEEWARAFRAELPERPTVRAEIEALLLWSLEAMWERREFMRVTVSQAAVNPEVGQTIAELNAGRTALIRGRLEHHRVAGRIRDDTDLDLVAETIAGLGFLGGFVAQVMLGGDREHQRRVVRETARVIADGLSARDNGGYGSVEDGA